MLIAAALEPLLGGCLFVLAAAAVAAPSADRAAADSAEQPGDRLVGQLAAGGQVDQGLLHDVVGGEAPLPRVQLERRRTAIDYLGEQLRRKLRHVMNPRVPSGGAAVGHRGRIKEMSPGVG